MVSLREKKARKRDRVQRRDYKTTNGDKKHSGAGERSQETLFRGHSGRARGEGLAIQRGAGSARWRGAKSLKLGQQTKSLSRRRSSPNRSTFSGKGKTEVLCSPPATSGGRAFPKCSFNRPGTAAAWEPLPTSLNHHVPTASATSEPSVL